MCIRDRRTEASAAVRDITVADDDQIKAEVCVGDTGRIVVTGDSSRICLLYTSCSTSDEFPFGFISIDEPGISEMFASYFDNLVQSKYCLLNTSGCV